MNPYLERVMMSNNTDTSYEVVFICDGIKYYGLTDEDIFFDTLERISSISKIYGSYKGLHICFSSTHIPDEDLRSLIGLFYRYRMDMKLLKVFLTESNKAWFFEDATTFWHDKVFC